MRYQMMMKKFGEIIIVLLASSVYMRSVVTYCKITRRTIIQKKYRTKNSATDSIYICHHHTHTLTHTTSSSWNQQHPTFSTHQTMKVRHSTYSMYREQHQARRVNTPKVQQYENPCEDFRKP
mgnify:CR=1 FL=1